jgi:hypothetical protein
MHAITKYRNTGYKNFGDLLAANPRWASGSGNVKVTDTSITLTGKSSAAGNTTANPEGHEALVFKMKYNGQSDWVGLALRQNSPDQLIWNGRFPSDGYLVVIKEKQIELQRFISSASDAMLATAENTYFKPDTEQEVIFGAIELEDGIRIILKCDGETVFDYTDNVKPVYNDGAFSITNINADGYITISAADELPTGRVFE